LHINSNRHAKLPQTCEQLQLQQLTFGCGATGIYPKFTFMKSACHKLSADIEIVLVLTSNQELSFFEYQRKLVPDFVNLSLRHIQHEMTQEVEQIEAWGFHCCINKVEGDIHVIITVSWIDALQDGCQYAFSEVANCIFLNLLDQYHEKQLQNVYYLFILFFSK